MTEAIIGAVALVVVALIGAWQNRTTRRMNTAEHGAAAGKRAEVSAAVLGAITQVHEEVCGVRELLEAHVRDDDVHVERRHHNLRVVKERRSPGAG